MVAVISVDAYPVLAFLYLTCHLEDTEKVFSGCTVLPDSKETKLESTDQEASPSAGKSTGIFLVSCCKVNNFTCVNLGTHTSYVL